MIFLDSVIFVRFLGECSDVEVQINNVQEETCECSHITKLILIANNAFKTVLACFKGSFHVHT